MKLISIKFNNFKTIKGKRLDIEKDITCLVGINESGKSNILLGIEKCDIEKPLTADDISRHSEEYLTGGEPSLEMVLVPESTETENLNEIFGINNIKKLIVVKTGNEYRVDYPTINCELSSLCPDIDQADEKVLTKEQEDEIRAGVVNAIKEKLPRFRFFDSVDFVQYYLPPDGDVLIPELLANPEQHAPVINLLKLASLDPNDLVEHSTPQDKTRRDTRITNGNKEINEKLVKSFWPIKTVIKLSAEGDTLKIRIKDKELFLPKERSRGLQWALAFNIYFMASCDHELKNTVLLIDEPGIFLHIEVQHRMLSSTFPKIAQKGNQIIYSTHLPFLIDKNHPQRLRILEKNNEDTRIGNKAWSTSEFGSIPEPVRTAIGMNIEEAFLFGNKNLIVEGPGDHIYLRIILEKFNKELLEKLTIVPAYGVEKISKVMCLAVLSNKEAYGVIDSDYDVKDIMSSLDKLGFKDKLNVKDLAALSENNKIKTIEDILPINAFKEAVYEVYEKEFEKRNWKLKRDEIPFSIPRVSSIENYFKTKLSSSRHRLLKMEIARCFNEIVSNDDYLTKEKEWKDAKSASDAINNMINHAASDQNQTDLEKEVVDVATKAVN